MKETEDRGVAKILRTVLLALLGSLLIGLLVGTLIRIRLERPVVYFVGQTSGPSASSYT